jgi:hypothetical protein
METEIQEYKDTKIKSNAKISTAQMGSVKFAGSRPHDNTQGPHSETEMTELNRLGTATRVDDLERL